MMGSSHICAPKPSAISFLVPAVVLATPWALWATFRTTDTWQSAFFDSGFVAGADCLARVALLIVLLESCRGVGRLAGLREDTLRNDLLALATGFAISEIVGGLLGYLGLLSPVIACLYFSVGLTASLCSRAVCLRPETFRDLPTSARLATAIAIAVGLIFVLARAIPIDTLSNDFAHYLPYYDWAKTNGHTFPSMYYIGAFYLKGAGLNHLVTLVSDPVGTQLVGAVAVLLIAFNAGWLAARLAWNSPLFGVATMTLVLLSKDFWLLVEPEKAHAPISAMLVTIIVLVALDAERALGRLERRAAAVIAFATPFMMPVASVYLIPLCALFPVICLRRSGDVVRAAQPLAAAILALAATLLFSFLRAGLFEFSPLKLMLALRNDEIIRLWIDPAAMLWFEAYNAQSFQIGFDAMGLLRNRAFLFCLGSLAASGAAFVMLRRASSTSTAIATLVAIFLSSTVFLTIEQIFPGQQQDLRRFSAFFPALAYLTPLALTRLLLDRRSIPIANMPTLHPGKIISLLSLVAVASQVSGPFALYAHSAAQGGAMVAGRQSRDQQIEAVYPAAECLAASRLVSANSQILVMGLQPSCYVMPGVKFHRFDMNPVYISFSDALFGDPDVARRAYVNQDIRYFLFSGSAPYIAIPAPQTFSPLFSPENMTSYFRIIARIGDDSWLLTLGREGTPVEQTFLDWYEAVRSKQANTTSARSYYALARARGHAGP